MGGYVNLMYKDKKEILVYYIFFIIKQNIIYIKNLTNFIIWYKIKKKL